MSAALKIFIIYAREDKVYKDDLLKSLKLLQNQGLIEPWHDNDIKPGDEWDKEIKAHLRAADIILPIISFDFINSDYIHRVEIEEAFERYDRNETLIVPIIAETCPWKDYPRLSELQALPMLGKPIKDWANKSKAMDSIYKGMKRIISNLNDKGAEFERRVCDVLLKNQFSPPFHRGQQSSHSKIGNTNVSNLQQEAKKRREVQRLIDLGNKSNDFQEKLEFNTKAISLDSISDEAHYFRGLNFYNNTQYLDAKKDFDIAIDINPDYSSAFFYRGSTEYKFKEYSKAILDFTKTLDLEPNNGHAYFWRGCANFEWLKYENAIMDFGKAISLYTKVLESNYYSGAAKEYLEEFEFAREFYLKVLSLEPSHNQALTRLKQLETKMI